MIIPAVTPGAAAPAWVTVMDLTSDGQLNGYFTYTIRQIINSTVWSPAISGTKMRFTIRSGTSSTFTVNAIWVGQQALSGDTYDYAAGTQVQITWDGGNAGFSSLAANTNKLSDEITIDFDPSKNYVIAIDIGETSGQGNPATKATQAGMTTWGKIESGTAGTADVTGYSETYEGGDGDRDVVAVMKIEVFGVV